MKILQFIFILSLLQSTIFAYVDNDIDGVEDSVDECLDTPFDELVDERGCSYDKPYYGKLSLKLGTDVSFDDFSDKATNFNIYANYRYNSWNLSLSNSSYSTYDRYNESSSTSGDTYLSGGYLFKKEDFNTKLTLGVKVATADEDVGTGENDYFVSVDYDYFVNSRQDIFAYFGLTFSGDSKDVDYEDYLSFSVGSGYAINSSWYSALSYNFSGSQYPDGDDYKSLSWFNSYQFSDKYFTTFNYSYALDDISFDHTFSLKFGVHFE